MSLGLVELIESGKPPQEAASLMQGILSDPDVARMLFELAGCVEGRELLEEWRLEWAGYGLEAPWGELLQNASPPALPETPRQVSTA